jgi:uncharacterized membrane protein YdjX (TVP38/TMEM64 family)
MNKSRAFIFCLALAALVPLIAVTAITLRAAEGLSIQQLRLFIESFEGTASLIFILMCTVRGLAFLPCGLFSALGGLLFGPLLGTIYTLAGLTAGSVITFYMARILGKGWAQRAMGHSYDKYEGYISRDSFLSIFLMRVIPVLPFDAVSCIAGMSRAGAGRYVMATLAGSAPGVFIYVYFGDSVGSMSTRKVVFSVIIIAIFAIAPFLFKYLLKLIGRAA